MHQAWFNRKVTAGATEHMRVCEGEHIVLRTTVGQMVHAGRARPMGVKRTAMAAVA